MQINRISCFDQTKSFCNQPKVSRPVSFGDLDYGYNGDILTVKSKSDIINNNVADKIDFTDKIKKEAKAIYHEAKNKYKNARFSFNNIFIAKKDNSFVSGVSTIVEAGNPEIEYIFGDGKRTFSTLTVTKKSDDIKKEFVFNNGQLVSYTETLNDGSLEKSITITRRDGFVYTEAEGGNYDKVLTHLVITGTNGNNNSALMTYEDGAKKQYIYNSKTNKWTLVKK